VPDCGEGDGGIPLSGVIAPGICLNLTRKGSVVVAAGEIVPSNNADAVLIVDEDADPEPADAAESDN